MKHLLIILIFLSCTRIHKRDEQVNSWIGRDVQELARHPQFSQFKVSKVKKDNDTTLVTYADGDPVWSDAKCKGLGGCEGFTEYWCEHIFTTKEDKIIHYKQYGPCPYNPNMIPIEDQSK